MFGLNICNFLNTLWLNSNLNFFTFFLLIYLCSLQDFISIPFFFLDSLFFWSSFFFNSEYLNKIKLTALVHLSNLNSFYHYLMHQQHLSFAFLLNLIYVYFCKSCKTFLFSFLMMHFCGKKKLQTTFY